MVAVPAQITQRVITRPDYVAAPDFATWERLNHWRLWDYWIQLEDDQEGTSSSFLDFAKVQYDLASTEETDDEADVDSRRFRSSDEREAYEAGVPARGEI